MASQTAPIVTLAKYKAKKDMSKYDGKSIGGMCVSLENSAFQACNFSQASDKTTLRTILRIRLAFPFKKSSLVKARMLN